MMDINTLPLDELYDLANLELRWASYSYGRVEMVIKLEDARSAYHQGRCDDDVAALAEVPYIKQQLDSFKPEDIRAAVKESHGGISADELEDDDTNKERLLWVLCGDIVEANAG